MTDIEKKALAVVNEVSGSGSWTLTSLSHPYNRVVFKALCRAIEQHEAFRQEVSDAIEALKKDVGTGWDHCRPAYACNRFIIAKPVDPLFEVVQEWWETGSTSIEETTDELREAIARRGGRIVWENEQ